MKSSKPVYDKYSNWLKEEHQVMHLDGEHNYYEQVVRNIKVDFEKSCFWKEFCRNLKEYNDEYLLATGYNLLYEYKPKIKTKPFKSFLLKTYRKNILNNKNWPKAPEGGWIVPTNWFTEINDIIRTLLVVKYLDGVEVLINKFKSHCESCKLQPVISLEAREEGYYAAHLYTKYNFEIQKRNLETTKLDISIEIQITTQLQEAIRKLLHIYYKKRRLAVKEEDIKWQWNYACDEFSANYLGHILHYVEGMIVEIREKQKRGIKDEKTIHKLS